MEGEGKRKKKRQRRNIKEIPTKNSPRWRRILGREQVSGSGSNGASITISEIHVQEERESPTSCILCSKRREGRGRGTPVEVGSMEFKIKKEKGGEKKKKKRKRGEEGAANIGNGRKLRATGKKIKAFACALCNHGLLVNHEQDILVSHFPRGPIRVQGRYEVGLREGKTTWGGGLVDFVGAYRRYRNRRRDDRTWSLPGREPTPLPRIW